MRFEVPQGFSHYREILLRMADIRTAGKWLNFRCPFGPSRHRNGDRNYSGLAWIGNSGELVARCLGCGANWREIVNELGTKPADWFPDRGEAWSRDQRRRRMSQPKPVLVATYIYRDRDGGYLYEKQRFEPGFDGRAKTFRFRRPLPKQYRRGSGVPDGKESWVYGIQGDEYGRTMREDCWDFYPLRNKEHQHSIVMEPCPPVLYRWPEMLAANPAYPVLVVEGEKDTDMLRDLGFTAVCGCQASSNWLEEWSRELIGRRVCLIPDHNRVGYQHADVAAGSMLRVGVASLRIVTWDGTEEEFYYPGEGGGVGNWLARIAANDEGAERRNLVVELCRRSLEYSRPQPAKEAA